MANQRIRIKLKSYDHNLVDLACTKIVEAAKKDGKYRIRSYSPAHRKGNRNGVACYAQI